MAVTLSIPNPRAGDILRLSGVIYTARDAASARMFAANDFPFDPRGAFIYFAGPTGAPEGFATGSIGPTTSGRMERYLEFYLSAGVRGFIGKGGLPSLLFQKYHALYLCAVGGAGALCAECVREAEIIAFPELGCEAVRKLTVENFPLICGIDETGQAAINC